MDLKPEKIADLRVKHLEMLLAVISRIAGQGATIKNYCITLTTALCGFSVTLQKPTVALLALLPVVVFALLDAQYLRLERRFRSVFDKVRSGSWETVPSFEMRTAKAVNASYWHALSSWSIAIFYAPLAVGVVGVVLITRQIYG